MDEIERYMREQERIFKNKVKFEKAKKEYNERRKAQFKESLIDILTRAKKIVK